MHHILLIEDSPEFQKAVSTVLRKEDLQLDFASTGKEARERLTLQDYDLILLDVNLPDISGFDLLLEFQQNPKTQNVSVIFLTAADEPTEKVTAFSMGAEDYIVKPFNSLEFRARIQAKLIKLASHVATITRGDILIDLKAHKAFRLMPNDVKNDLGLTHREYLLLHQLAKSEDQVFSREQLLQAVWGNNIHVFDRTVDVHICSLRKKIGPSGKFIEAVHSAGYRFHISSKRNLKAIG